MYVYFIHIEFIIKKDLTKSKMSSISNTIASYTGAVRKLVEDSIIEPVRRFGEERPVTAGIIGVGAVLAMCRVVYNRFSASSSSTSSGRIRGEDALLS